VKNFLKSIILIFILFSSNIYSNSLSHILYFEDDFVKGSSFQDFMQYDSSNMNVEFSNNFGGFDLNILTAKLDYNSKKWGASFNYLQSVQTGLELRKDEPTIDPLGKFGVYSKVFALEGYFRPIDYLTIYANTKVRRYSMIDYSENDFFSSLYLGTENYNGLLNFRVFAGVWNYKPNNKSVGNIYGKISYLLGDFKPSFSTDLKYYSLSKKTEVDLRISVVAYKLIGLYVSSQITGNNIFSTGLSVDYENYGISYNLHILKENVDPIHKIAIKIPIF